MIKFRKVLAIILVVIAIVGGCIGGIFICDYPQSFEYKGNVAFLTQEDYQTFWATINTQLDYITTIKIENKTHKLPIFQQEQPIAIQIFITTNKPEIDLPIPQHKSVGDGVGSGITIFSVFIVLAFFIYPQREG